MKLSLLRKVSRFPDFLDFQRENQGGASSTRLQRSGSTVEAGTRPKSLGEWPFGHLGVAMADGMLRSTFLVGAERQRKNLDEFKRREQQLAEAYHKNKPLCFNACSYQKTHPVKAQKGHKDRESLGWAFELLDDMMAYDDGTMLKHRETLKYILLPMTIDYKLMYI